jgi:hypothetical protein
LGQPPTNVTPDPNYFYHWQNKDGEAAEINNVLLQKTLDQNTGIMA